MTEVVVPPIGESITSVTLFSWIKHVGDEVRMGDILAELESDKSTISLECPAKGVVLATLVEEGETVEIGRLLAIIGKAGETWTRAKTPIEGEAVATPGAKITSATEAPGAGTDVRAAPSARRAARELGIDIADIAASLGGKRVTEAHVRNWVAGHTTREPSGGAGASAVSKTGGPPGHTIELSRVRKVVADRMTESAMTIPQFSVTVQVDARRLVASRERFTKSGQGPGITAYLVWAVCRAIEAAPTVNACYSGDGRVLVFDQRNVAVAVATEDGLRAPVIHGADRLDPAGIANRVSELVGLARDGKLGPGDEESGTFTISNLGSHGALGFVPMVVPGQCAILGIGAIQDVDGARTRPLFQATLAADHRVIDGAGAMRFLGEFKNTLETMLEGNHE